MNGKCYGICCRCWYADKRDGWRYQYLTLFSSLVQKILLSLWVAFINIMRRWWNRTEKCYKFFIKLQTLTKCPARWTSRVLQDSRLGDPYITGIQSRIPNSTGSSKELALKSLSIRNKYDLPHVFAEFKHLHEETDAETATQKSFKGRRLSHLKGTVTIDRLSN